MSQRLGFSRAPVTFNLSQYELNGFFAISIYLCIIRSRLLVLLRPAVKGQFFILYVKIWRLYD